MSNFLTNKLVALELAAGVGGRAARKVLDVDTDAAYGLGDWSQSLGAITREYRKSARTNQWVPMPVRRGKPEAITADLTMKMLAQNYIERFGEADRFTLFVRYTASDPTIPLDYQRIDVLCDVAIESFNRGGPVTDGTDDEADVVLTVPINAGMAYHLLKLRGKAVTHANLTGAIDCAITCIAVGSDGTLYAGTEADGTGTHPFVLTSPDGGDSWAEYELADLTAGISAMMVAGDKLFVAAGTTITYTDAQADLASATWTATTAAQTVAALTAIDAANLVAVGAAGLMLWSEDGGGSWTAIPTGSTAALGCVVFRDINEGYLGGATGTLLKYDQGTISTVSDPTSGATINTIALPEEVNAGREEDVYLGTADGKVWKSIDGGDSFVQYRFPGDNAGAVDQLGFHGYKGAFLLLLHTPVAGSSRVLRDISGGFGGNTEVEVISTPANSGLNAFLVANQNQVIAVGEVHSGTNAIVMVEA